MVAADDVLIVSGGYNPKHEIATSILYTTIDGTSFNYVELDKNAKWFLKGVGGPKTVKGDLKAVQVLAEIRQKWVDMTAVADAKDDGAAVADVADGAEDSNDDEDPMNDLKCLETPPKAKPKRRVFVPIRSMVYELEMPKRPPCVGIDQDATITISVYKKGVAARNRGENLYLRSDYIEWLLAYAADELHFQGVRAASPEKELDRPENCTAVAGLNLEWSFTSKAWNALFVLGPHINRSRDFHPGDVTQARWDQLQAWTTLTVPTFATRTTALERRALAKEVATQWGHAVLKSPSAVAEFEQIWDVNDEEPAAKRPKHSRDEQDGADSCE